MYALAADASNFGLAYLPAIPEGIVALDGTLMPLQAFPELGAHALQLQSSTGLLYLYSLADVEILVVYSIADLREDMHNASP